MQAERSHRPFSHLRHVLRGIVSRRVAPFGAVDPLHVREMAPTLQQLDENALTYERARVYTKGGDGGSYSYVLRRGNRNAHTPGVSAVGMRYLPNTTLFRYIGSFGLNVNPFRTAVPFWGQSSQISSSFVPKRDCGSKGVNTQPVLTF